MRCRDIMKSSPHCLNLEASALDAARIMRDQNVGFVPVCDATGRVVGAVTDRDITLRVVAEQLPPATTLLSNVMSMDIVACDVDDDVTRAIELMEMKRRSRIICLDQSRRLVGVISLSDIAKQGDASHTLKAIASREAHA